MDKNVKYLTVSLFFLLAITLAISFTIWMSSSNNDEAQRIYNIRFEGSISGLTLGSEVRYLGIPVGQVIGFNLKQDAGKVDVQVKILGNIPISANTIAELEPLGITGLAIIELHPNESPAELLVSSDNSTPGNTVDSGAIVIKGRSSLLSRLSRNSSEITEQVSDALTQIKQLLSDKNLTSISNSLVNLESSTQALGQTLTSIYQLSENIKKSNESAFLILSQGEKTLTTTNQEIVPELVIISNNLSLASSRLVSIAESVDELTKSNANHMQQLTKQGIPSALELIESLRRTSMEVEALLTQLNDNPSLIVYKQKENGVKLDP